MATRLKRKRKKASWGRTHEENVRDKQAAGTERTDSGKTLAIITVGRRKIEGMLDLCEREKEARVVRKKTCSSIGEKKEERYSTRENGWSAER